MRFLARACAIGVAAATLLVCSAGARQSTHFPREAVEAFGRLPVQDGGRVKPLASFARHTLLRAAGTAAPHDSQGQRLDASEWLLRLLLYPELAKHDPVILVEDSQALVDVGLQAANHEKRDRWSHAEVAAVLPQLLARAHAAEEVDAGRRTSVETVTIRVASSALLLLRTGRAFDFARARIPLVEQTRVALLYPGRDGVTIADVLERAADLHALESELAATDDGREKSALAAVWRTCAELTADAQLLAWIPPVGTSADEPAWRTPADLVVAARRDGRAAPEHVELLRAAEEVATRRTDPGRLVPAVATLVARVEALAAARGEGRHARLEAGYHDWGLLRWSTGLYVLGFVACAIGWLRPRGRGAQRAGAWFAYVASAVLTAAIVLRCVIRERPPVSTLYETVLFVTVCAALTALVVARIQRQPIHTAVASLVGAAGLMLAAGYEARDGQDTMPSLVAVLDTNFWLATHVTTITLGYAAGLLAAVLGSAYILIALVRGARAEAERQRSLARSVAGVTCFALLFALVGTILGGIWANESWGRFWGWDPKENGALLICIAQVSLIHGRRAGYLRDLGTCAAAAFGGTVVAFSWWGVNLLGVGLHSYGFTSGIQRALWTYYVLQWAVVALAAVVWWTRRRAAAHGRPGPAAAAAPTP
jgi:ABC-type transport system involved in cytochrome c biogenesis permease subunit